MTFTSLIRAHFTLPIQVVRVRVNLSQPQNFPLPLLDRGRPPYEFGRILQTVTGLICLLNPLSPPTYAVLPYPQLATLATSEVAFGWSLVLPVQGLVPHSPLLRVFMTKNPHSRLTPVFGINILQILTGLIPLTGPVLLL